MERKILVAVDHSEVSERVVQYVAAIVGGNENCVVRFFHVMEPLPGGLLEFGGSEDPRLEEILQNELRQKREKWRADQVKMAQILFDNAKAVLERAGVEAHAIETSLSNRSAKADIAMDLLEEARATHCDTIAVGRESFSWLRELSHRHVGDELIHRGDGLAVWVIE